MESPTAIELSAGLLRNVRIGASSGVHSKPAFKLNDSGPRPLPGGLPEATYSENLHFRGIPLEKLRGGWPSMVPGWGAIPARLSPDREKIPSQAAIAAALADFPKGLSKRSPQFAPRVGTSPAKGLGERKLALPESAGRQPIITQP